MGARLRDGGTRHFLRLAYVPFLIWSNTVAILRLTDAPKVNGGDDPPHVVLCGLHCDFV
eukprot:SAG31_NODE_1571_length_7851_cov_8.714525_5_plen_59_part_00